MNVSFHRDVCGIVVDLCFYYPTVQFSAIFLALAKNCAFKLMPKPTQETLYKNFKIDFALFAIR